MKRAAAVLFALSFASIALSAQAVNQSHPQNIDPSQHQAQTIVAQLPAVTGGCPVSLRAQQAAGGDNLQVNNSRPKGIAQGLHLILTNPDSRQIAAANVTVRGLTAKPRLTQALSNQTGSSDAARTLDVRFSAGPLNTVSADLWVPGLTSVQLLELNSVTYGDGSTWKLAAGNVCRTVPDGLMLIGNR